MEALTIEEAAPLLKRARVRVDGAEHAPRLRDYFLRLGCDARTAPGSADVTVVTEDTDVDLVEATAAWIRANLIGATIHEDGLETPAEPPVTHPAPAIPRAPRAVRPPAPTPIRRGPRLGDLLMRKGMISEAQLQQALGESRTTGERVGEILLKHRWVFEDELARTLAEQLDVPYINVVSVGVDWGAVKMLSPEIGIRYAAIPVRFGSKGVMVAFADPSDDEALEAVTEAVGTPTLAVAELSMIRMLWNQFARK